MLESDTDYSFRDQIQSNILCLYLINECIMGFFFFLSFLSYRTLPAKHFEKIAEQMREHNINALLIVGGFEVCPC